MDDILRSCKKCFVKTIINPGLFWMTDCNKKGIHENEVKHVETLLARERGKYKKPDCSQICVGQIVIVLNNGQYCRGLIHDIYKKNSQPTFEIFLIDYGVLIKTIESKIFLLTNSTLKIPEFGAFKVILYGVQPITLEINDNNNLTAGVFQKRVSNVWSTAAYKFVKSQLDFNSVVFVKSIEYHENTVIGEIYLLNESDEKPKSLGQMLCDKDFARFGKDPLDIGSESAFDDCEYKDIMKKIPQPALSRRMKNFNMFQQYMDKDKVLTSSSTRGNLSIFDSAYQDSSNNSDSINCSSQSLVSTSEQTFTQRINSPTNTTIFSPSWVIKKLNKTNVLF